MILTMHGCGNQIAPFQCQIRLLWMPYFLFDIAEKDTVTDLPFYHTVHHLPYGIAYLPSFYIFIGNGFVGKVRLQLR